MTTTPSLDGSGMVSLRTADVTANLEEAVKGSAEFGTDAQLGADKVLGQALQPPAAAIGAVYELIQACWDAWDPDTAEGTQLDNLCRLIGITRQPATYSTATVTLTGTAATVIAAGKRCRVAGGAIFALDAAATIGGGGTVDAAVTCTETGAKEAAAGSIDEIVDAVAGWTAVTNAADAEIGDEIETDTALRLRRKQTIAAGGSCTDQAARAALEALDDVSAAVVISNRTSVTDAYGIPAHNRLSVVYPSTADGSGVARAIWDHLGGGLRPHGTQSATITDDQGHAETARWSWATGVDIYWVIDVTTTSEYPTDGDDLIKAAVLAYGNALSVADDVLPIGAVDAIYDAVPGVAHLVVKVGKTAAPTGTVPIDIGLTEVSDHDTTRITVNS